MKKRIVSVLLVFSMLLTMLPVTALAEGLKDNSVEVKNPFSDVSKLDWFYDSVMYAVEHGLFSGVSANRFDPRGTMTRAMYVTVMGRMAEIDTAAYGGRSGFQDVDPESWCGPYVAWAKEQGITGGVGGGRFDSNGLITREQMAAMTVRFFDVYQIEYPPSTAVTTPMDADSVSAYAKSAVSRLWACGLFQGDNAGNFNPKANASRGEAATFFARVDHIVEQWLIETGKKEDPVKKEDPDEGVSYTYYQITFESNGGGKVDSLSRQQGSRLGNLPTPYLENNIFHGWCYDSALSRLVASSDTLTQNITLYAKWGESMPLPEDETQTFARAIDTNPDFVIKITAPAGWTAEQVRGAITVRNISSNEDKEWVAVKKEGDAFVVSGINYNGENGAQQAGFIEGANYKLTLNDDALAFAGQSASARIYDFTIQKEAVMNVSLNADTIYIHAGELSDLVVNGKPATEISIAVITVGQDGSTTQNGAQTVGSFTYTKGTLALGDSVAIYQGAEIPTMESSQAGDELAFVKITAVNGTSYSYQGAVMDDVLFMPDVLPVSEGADTDGNSSDNSITVPAEVMTFTDDKYANLGLTSQTTIDVGDFIAFYTGDLGDNGSGAAKSKYAKIETVTERDDAYTIGYTVVTQEQMMEAMSAYRKDQLDGETLLEGVDTEAVERSIEQQARDSGFADEAGMYLAAMALETDSFTEISEDFDLSGYTVTMPDGVSRGELAMARGGKVKVDVEVTTLQATISTNLIHFEDMSGLRLTLTVGVEVTIHADKGDIVITITGSFEQEVKIDLGVDGCAVWKWWFIFPYIAEYKVTAWVDLYAFTGIGIEATIVTKEADDGEGMGTGDETFEDIGQQIKDLLDEKDKYLGDGEGTVASTLEEKYAKMLENESDWVELFSKDIFTQHFRIILIIDIEIKITFVVTANMNISLGLDFWYENGKRYLYSVEIFSGRVTNDTIDLVEEHYEFEFYVMGTMGLRAGVKASVAIGLFSTKLASVGFGAEAGVYVRVWGYFYYQLVYRANASPQKNTHYAGALLFELGIYLEITFLAQAFNGTFSYNPTLYENEWPMWSAGSRESIQSFAYEPEDSPTLNLKKAIQTTIAPDALFEMAYLDLKTGDEETKIFDDAPKYFTIAMTNDKFSYDRATNRLTVLPGEGDFNLDGEMILTWVNQPLAFSSAAIQRRIPLHWDNLSDGYAIVFHTNGGSSIPIIIGRYGVAIKAPQDPVKKGYAFAGWYSDKALTQAYAFPETMPNVDTELYAKWTPAADTPYRVEHYGEVLGRTQYELLDAESLQGVTDAEVSAATKAYPGYTAPEVRALTISPDGSGVLRYYYDLTAYTLTFDPGVAQGNPFVTTLKYGAAITPPVFSSKGYSFTGWDSDVLPHMPAENLIYVAKWQAGADTPYRAEYYVEQPDGRFTLQRLEEKTGKTGDIVDVAALLDQSYLVLGGISYRDVTAGGEATIGPAITEDGKLIIKVNYAREKHSVTYDFANAAPEQVDTYRYGARITKPADPIRAGYTFTGWSAVIPDVMGTADLHITAQWRANTGTAYKVEHYQQNANDDGYTLADTERLTGETDTTATAVSKGYAHFTPQDAAAGNIVGDGSLVLKLYYHRDTFTVDYTVEGSPYAQRQTYKHGQTVVYPAAPTLEGYNFGYWELNGAAFVGVMPAETITLSAKWLAMTEYAYTVRYSKQGLNGGTNILVRSESPTGEFGSEVTVTPTDSYEGFTTPAEQTVTITKGLVVDHIYTRNSYALTWNLDGGTATNAYTPDGEVEFETPIVAPALTKTGYTYVWDQDIAAKMGVAPLSYTAVWTANTYTVKFDAGGGAGTMADMAFTYDGTQSLTSNSYTRDGYTFAGWALTANAASATYTDGASVQNLTAAVNGQVILYAVWAPITYAISYELNGGTNSTDNPTEYTVEDNITLREPTKPGYTFVGWYTDAAFEHVAPDIAIAAGSTCTKSFYAKWTANTYTVIFHKNVGDGVTESQSFTYDAPQSLRTNSFTRDGYTFDGWATAADGTGSSYTDGQSVQNLAESGSCNLYAQWKSVSFTITYELGGGTNHAENPTSYTVESADITLKAPTRTGGYGFMGWFDGEKKVTGITKGSTGNKTLTAKWGFAGSFTVQNNDNNTFTITRNGDGSGGAQNVGQQTVYFRTVNGTAIGGTHFVHKGGSSAALTFADGMESQTVTIDELGVAKPYRTPDGGTTYEATAYSNIDRSYSVELVNVVGGGVLGDITKATRVMQKDNSKAIDAGFYQATTFYGDEQKFAVDKWGASNYEWERSTPHNFSTDSYTVDGVNYTATRLYWENTASNVNIDASIDFDERFSCWVAFRITEYNSFDSVKASKTRDSGGIDRESLSAVFDATTKGVSAYYGLKGAADNWVWAKWPQYTLKVNDTREPKQIGIAPMAEGSYKAGETVTISVVFDEIVANANGATISGTNLAGSWSCTGGTGSNVLTFTGMLSNDCTDDTLTSGVTLSGTVSDMAN